jgi:hypothetical protein
VTNPTFGTGIVQNVDTAFAPTKPLIYVFNADAAGGVSLFLDYIKLINAVTGATSTSAHLAMVTDTGVDRYTSGGTKLADPAGGGTPGGVSVNTGLTVTPKARIHFGAITAGAAGSARQVSRDMVKTQAAPCWTVGDEVYVKFDTFDFSPALTSGAATAIFGVPSGPAIIAPQHSFLLYLWHPALTVAPQWELEIGWWEGPGAS